MHFAAHSASPELFNTLILAGADFEAKDFYGRKPEEILKAKNRGDILKVKKTHPFLKPDLLVTRKKEADT